MHSSSCGQISINQHTGTGGFPACRGQNKRQRENRPQNDGHVLTISVSFYASPPQVNVKTRLAGTCGKVELISCFSFFVFCFLGWKWEFVAMKKQHFGMKHRARVPGTEKMECASNLWSTWKLFASCFRRGMVPEDLADEMFSGTPCRCVDGGMVWGWVYWWTFEKVFFVVFSQESRFGLVRREAMVVNCCWILNHTKRRCCNTDWSLHARIKLIQKSMFPNCYGSL